MSSKIYMGAAALVLGAILAGCQKSDKGTAEAETPQNFPAPGINFYSDESYDGLDVDDSIYFGNRQAYLYYFGPVSVNQMVAADECLKIMNRQNYQYLAVAMADLGGYDNYWRKSGNRRYGRIKARRGDTMARIEGWRTNQGHPFTQVRSGLHLVCLMGNAVQPMGMFFDANAEMQTLVNVNMQFQNRSVHFSQPYFGKKYKMRTNDFRPRDRDRDRERDTETPRFEASHPRSTKHQSEMPKTRSEEHDEATDEQ